MKIRSSRRLTERGLIILQNLPDWGFKERVWKTHLRGAIAEGYYVEPLLTSDYSGQLQREADEYRRRMSARKTKLKAIKKAAKRGKRTIKKTINLFIVFR